MEIFVQIDGSISVMQEIVLCFSCDCSVRMPSCKEIRKFIADTVGRLIEVKYGGSQLPKTLRSSEGCHSHLQLVPSTLQPYLRPAPCCHSPTSGLTVVCELALCPVHYAQVWLLVTIYLTHLRDLWACPPQLEACWPFL